MLYCEKFDRWFDSNSVDRIYEYYSQNSLTHYHRLSHIGDCWMYLKHPSIFPHVSSELKFSIIYHDIIYDPSSNKNEENSAALAILDLSSIYKDEPKKLSKIVDLILSTKHNRALTSDEETQCILDIDLSILGSEPKKYELYSSNVFLEYRPFVSRKDYVKGRIEFLSKMLDRSKIYYKLKELEVNARKNISNEILHLSGKF